VLVTSPAWATTIEPGQGDLSINQGRGYQPVSSRLNANVGDTVMVGQGGAATVVYDDGCKVNVQPGAVTTIAPLSPCTSGSNAQTGPSYYPDCRTDPNGRPYDCGPDWPAIAFGVVTAGALGIAIWEATKKNGSTTPTSP
jgi:hypothetical protein